MDRTLPLSSSPSAEVAAHSGVRAPREAGCNAGFCVFYVDMRIHCNGLELTINRVSIQLILLYRSLLMDPGCTAEEIIP